MVIEQGDPPGGIYNYLDHIYKLKTLQSEWKKKRNFTFVFHLNEFEFWADTLIVFDDRNKILKKSGQIYRDMQGIMLTNWKPMKLNGKAVRLRKDVNYIIEFIYREE